ncbi:unnamed protein product [Paramecium octaurelia]|uniref:PARP catalytic domain-containing protein n=1 Tax=Paramecium octaurelia TaxID=43137 RepID=A0A8S1XRV3_PAROT|nr:unnamed protein product [Paramecium octaurelia]
MYHGTQQKSICSIVKKNLQPGFAQYYANDECRDQFGNQVYVGQGIYFTDKLLISTQYCQYTPICNKQFAVIFMSRVSPNYIRQSKQMKENGYFLINKSLHIRPYRILLHEKNEMN